MHYREGNVNFRKKRSTLEDFNSLSAKLKPHPDLLFQCFHGAFLRDILVEAIRVFPIRDLSPPVKGLIIWSLHAFLSSRLLRWEEMRAWVAVVTEQVYFAFVNFKRNLHLSLKPVRAQKCIGSLFCPWCYTGP